VSADREGAAALTSEALLRPGELRDTYSTDDGTVVLVAGAAGHRVVRLSPLGSAVLEAVGSGTTLAALEVELRSRLGEPPAGNLSELVLSATLALVDEDLIVAGQGHKDDNSGVTQP
jgi:hypothetical protein